MNVQILLMNTQQSYVLKRICFLFIFVTTNCPVLYVGVLICRKASGLLNFPEEMSCQEMKKY